MQLAAETPMLVTPDGATVERIVGGEQEYGLSFMLSHDRSSAEQAYQFARDFHYFRPEYQAGGRFYLDADHPEYATPETIGFSDYARRVLRGHHVVAQAYAGEAQRRGLDPSQLRLYANTWSPNADNGSELGASYGCHLNLLARRSLEDQAFRRPLITHHAARIVLFGSGAPILNDAGTFSYRISERAPFIQRNANQDTIRNRALFNTRDEPLGSYEHYRRLHDVSGETNFIPLLIAMKPALDSLILRCCELGQSAIFEDLELAHPVAAMHQIADDPDLTSKVQTQRGRRLTGIELEQEIIGRALKTATAAEYVTDEEVSLAEQALGLLGQLALDPMSATVDWVVKRKLIERQLSSPDRASSDQDTALLRAIDYHRISPGYGTGMQLALRLAGVEAAADIQAETMAPPDTRARVRQHVLDHLGDYGLYQSRRALIQSSWRKISARSQSTGVDYELLLDDPYNADITAIEAQLKTLQPQVA